MVDKRFILELNENQLKLVKESLEEYFRIRMDQWVDLADSLTMKGMDMSSENPKHKEIFNDFLIRRECVKCALESVGKMLWGYGENPKSKEQLIAEDIWRVVRYTLWSENHKPGEDTWCVDSYPPMNCSGEPLPKCYILNEPPEMGKDRKCCNNCGFRQSCGKRIRLCLAGGYANELYCDWWMEESDEQ